MAQNKVGCVYSMAIVSILPHVKFGSYEHRGDSLHFRTIMLQIYYFISPERHLAPIFSDELVKSCSWYGHDVLDHTVCRYCIILYSYWWTLLCCIYRKMFA